MYRTVKPTKTDVNCVNYRIEKAPFSGAVILMFALFFTLRNLPP